MNRGPKSAETLRFVKSQGSSAVTVLGNHDLHLLAEAYGLGRAHKKDTLKDVLNAPDRDELLEWLRFQPLMHYDETLGISMAHAGVHPEWSIAQARELSADVEAMLRSDKHIEFYHHMYGNKPSKWSNNLKGWDRMRFIVNAFTRMRFYDADTAKLLLNHKGAPGTQPSGIPWFLTPQRPAQNDHILFGHWSTLPDPGIEHIHPLDTGCLWGGQLTALRIDSEPFKINRLECSGAQQPHEPHGPHKKSK